MIEKVQPPPFGRRVRLTKNYATRSPLDIQIGDELNARDTKADLSQIGIRRSALIIPEGTEGTVARGYGSGVIAPSECPVRWDFKNPELPEILGTPWNIIEFVGGSDVAKQPFLFNLFPALQKLFTSKKK